MPANEDGSASHDGEEDLELEKFLVLALLDALMLDA